MPAGEHLESGLGERDVLAIVDRRLEELGQGAAIRPLPTFGMSERPPPAVAKGLAIYVPDGAAGSRFQGSDGESWVSLG